MKKTDHPTRRQENDYEEDTYVNVIELNESKKLPTLMDMDYKPKSNGFDFSFGEVNAAFEDITDVNISPVYPSNACPDFEVLPTEKQKVQKSILVVLGVLMIIVLVTLVVFIANIYPQYLTVSGAVTDLQRNDHIVSGVVTDLQQNVSEFQKLAMEEQDNLKAKVADLSDLMDKVCTVCPIGWHTIGSSCYYLSEEQRSWEGARYECYKVNSFLVIIKDKNESDSLNTLFTGKRSYWMGLRRDSKNIHIWKWIDGSEVTFTNWAVNEPNYYLKEEHCGENLSGPWNDENCKDKLNYICEKDRFC